MDRKYNYEPSQDYCYDAEKSQSVPSAEEKESYLIRQQKEHSPDKVNQNRSSTLYSCNDSYQMGTIQDDRIYIATTDWQHDQIVNHENVTGLSGYFSDQATVDACKSENGLDNAQYNEMCQIAPWRENGLEGEGDASYKPHVDCFEIDRDRMQEVYGTTDFNAAIAKCEANNQFGQGGGNQGYNPHISEMIENSTLKHRPEESFTDKSLSNSLNQNSQDLVNSTVDERKYEGMMLDATARSSDCVQNNTAHPSPEARNNGYPHNENPIESNTGNATVINNHSQSTNGNNNSDNLSKDSTTICGTKPDSQTQQSPPDDRTNGPVGNVEAANRVGNNEFDLKQGEASVKPSQNIGPTQADGIKTPDNDLKV